MLQAVARRMHRHDTIDPFQCIGTEHVRGIAPVVARSDPDHYGRVAHDDISRAPAAVGYPA
jgi:hypothetical protein